MSTDPMQVDRRVLLQNALAAVEKMQGKLEAYEQAKREPIAIIGMSCRFPGGANSPEAYWQLLRSGVDATSPFPLDRWTSSAAAEGYDPQDAYWHGGFIEGIDQFDAQFFGLARREVASMDPQQRLVLEVSWEALERAGQAPDKLLGSQTGIFIGITTNDYGQLALLANPTQLDAYVATGGALNVAPGRVAYTLGLQGPSVAVDTACSSSLVAIHLACQSLRSGESNLALAGGVNVLLRPEAFVCFKSWGMMSSDGHCKTFDARADGFVRGEGCGVVVLKRFSDAVANGDNILALIRGSAVNQDGKSSGLTVPNGLAQEAVIRTALKNAGVKPFEISYVEAHGTGTALGDPIEVEALGSALGEGRTKDQPLFLGSVKTNIGHLESAAGIAGIIKTVLAMQHGEIPPHLHLKERSPKIPWPAFPVIIPTQPTAWDSGNRSRLAGISSFGFSGTNAHVVLEEAPTQKSSGAERSSQSTILSLSAKNDSALQQLASNFEQYLTTHPETLLNEVAFTANCGRAHLPHRLAIVAESSPQAAEQLRMFIAGETSSRVVNGEAQHANQKIAFLFTGQGSQYIGMGHQLYENEPIFRQSMDRCNELLGSYLKKPLLQVLYPGGAESLDPNLLHQTAYTQPALFALEYSLAELWKSWGIEPSAVMGHSVGEYVAACVAGVFSLDDGLKLIEARGRLMQALPAGGKMAAVFAELAKVAETIQPYADQISIAALNGEHVVISGAGAAVEAVLERLEPQSIKYSRLNVSHAFHSALLEPMLEDFFRVAASIKYTVPSVQLISNVTGQPINEEVTHAKYWRDHIRATVEFAKSLQTLQNQGYQVFLEIGPKPTLISMGQRVLPDNKRKSLWLASLREGKDDRHQILQTLATLHVNGIVVDWNRFHARESETKRRLILPVYPFQHSRHWFETPKPRKGRDRQVMHPLVHRQIRSPRLNGRVFESEIGVDLPAFLNDHRIYETAIFPGTGYLEMALTVAAQAFEGKICSLENVNIEEMLSLPEAGEKTVQVLLSPLQTDQASFEIYSLDTTALNQEEAWKRHASGTIRAVDASAEKLDSLNLENLKKTFPNQVDVDSYYQQLAELGLNYGPAFRCIRQILRKDGEALGSIALPKEDNAETQQYQIHPALLDACFQLLGAATPSPQKDESKVYVPIGMRHSRVYLRGQSEAWAWVTFSGGLLQADGSLKDTLTGDIRLLTSNGELIAEILGLQLRRIDHSVIRQTLHQKYDDWLYQLNWESAVRSKPKSSLAGKWLILADKAGVGKNLADRMQSSGTTPLIVTTGQEYKQLGENHWQIDASQASHFERLFAELATNTEQTLRGILHLWSLDHLFNSSEQLKNTQSQISASTLNLVQSMAKNLSLPVRLWLVTRGAQVFAVDQQFSALAQASLWGLGRTIALEYPAWRCTLVDLDPAIKNNDLQLLEEIISQDDETQIALRGTERFVARLTHPQAPVKTAPDQPFELVTTSPGLLDNLTFQSTNRRTPDAGEIEIQVRATGLNFRDVLFALGLYPGADIPLGNECTGIITALGEDVRGFAVGDEVIGLVGGAFCSHAIVPVDHVFRKPANLTLAETATIPTAFLTAYYGLHHLANLQQSDRVLIHAAAGGVGLAAVQLAQQAGATVFATAGSERKRDYLRSLGVEYVFDSRSLGFAEEIMQVTESKGVNIVLNSLADEFIPKSLSILAEHGRFLEIGKRDAWDQDKVAAIYPTAKYYRYDLGLEMAKNLPLIQEMLNELLAEFESGVLKPLPLKVFPIESVRDAFRFMAQAKHTGKVVVTQREVPSIHSNVTYLITGGLGGLGLVTARWVIEKGARHLALLSRTPPNEEMQKVLKEFNSNGVETRAFQCDVSQCEQVEKILHTIEAEMPPLRGILHAAGVLDDGVLRQQSVERFERVLSPKVQGAWNLHFLTRNKPMDFFLLFSSAASLLGSAGQSNYAMANAFLDGLAHYRRAQGLPALSINWGAWAEVGMAARLDPNQERRWSSRGIDPIQPSDGTLILEQLLSQPSAQIGVLPIQWQKFLGQTDETQVLPFLRHFVRNASNEKSVHQETSTNFLEQLTSASQDQQRPLLLQHVTAEVVKVLGLRPSDQLNMRQGFSEIGMDSLMAVELSNRLQKSLGHSLPSTLTFEYPTIESLTNYLATDVLAFQAEETSSEPSQQIDKQQALIDEIDKIREDDLEDALLKELKDAGY